MPVPTVITDCNATLASNSPAGTDSVGTNMDDYLRAAYGFIAQLLAATQSNAYTAFTTGGTSTAYTLTPSPAITALAANQRFRVKFNAAAGATPTLAVSGLTAKNLKYYDSAGSKQAITSTQVPLNWIADVEYDGTDWVLLDIPPPAVRSKVIETTCDLSLGTNFSVTGVGFTPSAVIAVATKSGNDASWGFADSALGDGSVVVNPGVGYTYDSNLLMYYDGTNVNRIAVVSYDADGATFSRTKTNSPTGTLNIKLIFLR